MMETHGILSKLHSIDDFKASGYETVFQNSSLVRYNQFSEELFKFSKEKLDSGESIKSEIIKLCAEICSMCLVPTSKNKPFQPICTWGNQRSTIPDDLSGTDLSFMELILPINMPYQLKARMADLLWLLKKSKNIEHTEIALQEYLKFPVDSENFVKEGKEVWLRATILANQIQKGKPKYIQEIKNKLLSTLLNSDATTEVFPIWLSENLEIINIEKSEILFIIKKLEDLNEKIIQKNNFHFYQIYFDAIIKWSKKLNDKNKEISIIVKKIEGFEKEGDERAGKSNLTAAQIYEKAIQTCRLIPKKYRSNYNIEEKISSLHSKMNKCNQLGLGELKKIKSPKIDLSKAMLEIQNIISGKHFPEVLLQFTNLINPIDIKRIEETCKIRLKEYPLLALSNSHKIRFDGRAISKTPRIGFLDQKSNDYKETLKDAMIKEYLYHVQINAQLLTSALQVINLEHRIAESELLQLIQSSSVIPQYRELFWLKGISCGFEGDFFSAIHLLVPQIEHLIRQLLKQENIKTTTIDRNGIETENGLSTLLENEELSNLIGEDIFFELKALLTDAVGPNIRNELAHGLLEQTNNNYIFSIYIWWFSLKLILDSKPHKKTLYE